MNKAPQWMRLPIIRHIRWVYYNRAIERYFQSCGHFGYFAAESGQHFTSASDCEILDKIWSGEL